MGLTPFFELYQLKRLRAFAPIVLVLVLLSGGMAEKPAAKSDKQLFESIHTGMSRADVEKLLGKPAFEFGNEVYYGKRPKIEKWQSPVALTSILVVYSDKNVIESKRFYGGND